MDHQYRWRQKVIGVAARLARLEWLDEYGVDLDADPRSEQMRTAAITLREGVEEVQAEIVRLRAALDDATRERDAWAEAASRCDEKMRGALMHAGVWPLRDPARLVSSTDALIGALDAATRERDEYKLQRDNARRAEAEATWEADGLLDKVLALEAAIARPRAQGPRPADPECPHCHGEGYPTDPCDVCGGGHG